MDARKFVSYWKSEKDSILAALRQGDGLAGQQIYEIGLAPDQLSQACVSPRTSSTSYQQK